MRQKGQSQNGVNKKIKHAKFFEKPYSLIRTRKKCLFLETFGVFYFLETPF